MDRNHEQTRVTLTRKEIKAIERARVRLVMLRASAMAVLMILYFLFKSSPELRGINPAPDDKCIIDRGLDLYTPINQAVHDPKNRGKRKFIQIISSEQIDISFITLSLVW